jgi:hypothetical protein
MNNLLMLVMVFANIITGVGFLLATASVSKTHSPGYLWQTVLLRAAAVVVYLTVAYDFFRQTYYLLVFDDFFLAEVGTVYIISRLILAFFLPVGLWIMWRVQSVKIVSPAVESYVEQMIREVEEEEARRKTYDASIKVEASRRADFNRTVVDEAPIREKYDTEVGREEIRRQMFDDAHK